MSEQIQLFTPMIYCDGALEAISFYEDVFGAKEITDRRMLASHVVPGAENDPELSRTVVYAKLQFSDGSALNVADHWGDPTARNGSVTGNNVHIGTQHTSPATQQRAFEKLAAEGTVHEALESKPWGAVYGIVQDKYGVIWEMNCYAG
ncbi:glyoxalase/bleomycin resistance/extradiol dioxygenase family protein [Streptomyces sp. G1]|uniref:VOC family protein n=1 Tax=Streptomyces sp. G1 TaxID=361572 RepID=UPI00202F8449|nr:VOC family protein [Streptomyces sp. G1]MCM1971492.1 VOC family protein [Streptomyces sp. G1]